MKHKSPFPALNVHFRQEDIATDTAFADTLAVDNGSTFDFVGIKSFMTDVYGMKTNKK